MEISPEEKLHILDRISDGKPVSDDESRWAVAERYAKLGEDWDRHRDIELTHKGREAIDNRHV